MSNSSCIISGLPIGYDEKVMLIVLYKPYPEEINCYPSSNYSPAFLPLKCVYDEYGIVGECLDEKNYNIINQTIREIIKLYQIKDQKIVNNEELDLFNFIFEKQKIKYVLKPENDIFSLKGLKTTDKKIFKYCYIKLNVWNKIVKNYKLRLYYEHNLKKMKNSINTKEDSIRKYKIFDMFLGMGGQSPHLLSYNYYKDYVESNYKNNWFNLYEELIKVDCFMNEINLVWRESKYADQNEYNESHSLYLNIINNLLPKKYKITSQNEKEN